MSKIFKSYNQSQQFVLPPNIDALIPEGHVVRVVNEIIEKLDIRKIISGYKGGGASSYHPIMMLKVLIYSYIDGIYTCRKIAKAVRENIVYMWLAGMQVPDFRTINNFRNRLKDDIKEILKQVVEIAIDLGLVDFEKVFADGTKMEASSNKYKIVWKKSIERRKENVTKKIEDLWQEIDRLNEEEDKQYGNKDLPEVGKGKTIKSEDMQKAIREGALRINKKLQRKKETLTKKLNGLTERKARYEQAEEILGKRNSYCKVDPDASGMKMKDGQIKPGYNLLIATENQVIVNYEVEQNASDGTCFINLMNGIKKLYKRNPKAVGGDAAFGNEENYEYCKRKRIKAFLKYSTFFREKKKKYKQDIFRKEHLPYDPAKDVYQCPNGKLLRLEWIEHATTATGYRQTYKVYGCNACIECLLKQQCTKAERRIIKVNEKLDRHKEKARTLLQSPEGIAMRKQRGTDVETPFGDLKYNNKFKRFLLRSIKKINIEAGLHAIGHNIKKISKKSLLKLKDKNKII